MPRYYSFTAIEQREDTGKFRSKTEIVGSFLRAFSLPCPSHVSAMRGEYDERERMFLLFLLLLLLLLVERILFSWPVRRVNRNRRCFRGRGFVWNAIVGEGQRIVKEINDPE